MAGLGLGLYAEEEEEAKKEVGRRRRARPGFRWSNRRRGVARNGAKDESCFYSSGHSSVDNGSFNDDGLWFASLPGSFGGRCSFGSDISALSSSPRSPTLLAGCEPSLISGLDSEQETRASSTSKSSSSKRNDVSESKVQQLNIVKAQELQQGERNSNLQIFAVSHNFRDEFQNQRVTFESLSSPGGQQRWRTDSLDLNDHVQNVGFSSIHPSSYGIKNGCAPSMHSRSNMFPSPGTPNYWHSSIGAPSYQKGWSSERVPLPASRLRRYGANTPLFPFNNGKTLPSKWEDAERWICSPVSGDGSRRTVVLPPYHRRPKSKSGPLEAPVLTYASAEPHISCFDNGQVVKFSGSSPLMAGVLVTDQQFCGITCGGQVGQECCNSRENICTRNSEGYIDKSAGMHGHLDLLVEPSPLFAEVFQGHQLDWTQEIATVSSTTLSRDIGTQMSPQRTMQSSPNERPSLSRSPLSVHTVTELQNHFPCQEIRDVQVDDRVTVTRWSKKNISRCSDRRSIDIIEWKRKTLEPISSDWEVVNTGKHVSKYDKEEAKITAWENLQKAKAEAALQNLEIKLEKKRSSSMEKILNRLRLAQRKAEDMRSSVVDRQICMVPRAGQRVSYFKKYSRMTSLRGCFTCHAFYDN